MKSQKQNNYNLWRRYYKAERQKNLKRVKQTLPVFSLGIIFLTSGLEVDLPDVDLVLVNTKSLRDKGFTLEFLAWLTFHLGEDRFTTCGEARYLTKTMQRSSNYKLQTRLSNFKNAFLSTVKRCVKNQT